VSDWGSCRIHTVYCVKKNFVVYLNSAYQQQANLKQKPLEGNAMKWETPAYTDLRFGFEVTMYIYNR
jgi:pyrroloquinoline quinone biosynthesis protein A